MRAYEKEDFVGREARSVRVAADISDGPYRLRGASDAVWAAQGYGQRHGVASRLGGGLVAIGRTIIPAIFLSMSLAAIYLYKDSALAPLANTQGRWLTVGHFLLPAAFLAIHLTNRRYGPSYAFAQIVASFALCGAVVLFGSDQLRHLQPAPSVPTMREAASFSAAFFAAGFLCIVAFDGARGPRWWMAPLVGSVVSGLSFVLIFYPAAFAGTDAPWVDHMAINAGILFGAAVLGIFPYWLLRGLIQPLPGFGGY